MTLSYNRHPGIRTNHSRVRRTTPAGDAEERAVPERAAASGFEAAHQYPPGEVIQITTCLRIRMGSSDFFYKYRLISCMPCFRSSSVGVSQKCGSSNSEKLGFLLLSLNTMGSFVRIVLKRSEFDSSPAGSLHCRPRAIHVFGSDMTFRAPMKLKTAKIIWYCIWLLAFQPSLLKILLSSIL